MDWRKLHARYMRDEWPVRLGNLASTLGRVTQRLSHPDALTSVPSSLREAMWFIEWSVRGTPPEVLLELAPMQAELGLWRRSWDTVAQSFTLRMLLSRRARQMSDRVLELSGLLESSQRE